MSWGLCALGPPNQRGLPFPSKKYKRAGLAGGERFWAGTSTVLQYNIINGMALVLLSMCFLGLGSWLRTVTWIETLILTFIPCICAVYCSDSSGCNTRIKVKHQITKLLTKVLTHADALRWDRMHYGETECLKQRCVHQHVSDSSGWLMLMHFNFKFNAQTVLVAIQESKLNIK